MNTMPLNISVLTSSSGRKLDELMLELSVVSAVRSFDLFLLRETDCRDVFPDPATRLLELLADEANVYTIADWVTDKLEFVNATLKRRGLLRTDDPLRIAAIATFVPEIVDRTSEIRKLLEIPAVPPETDVAHLSLLAVANAIRIASILTSRGWMKSPLVEIVCGTVHEQIDYKSVRDAVFQSAQSNDKRRGSSHALVFESERQKKWRLLCERLLAVQGLVSKTDSESDWTLALELEPGPTYTLHDFSDIRGIRNQLQDHVFSGLRQHIGLNVDIAHMKIAGVSSAEVSSIRDWVVHAHIADHPPGMHTRDQPLGWWDPVDRYNSQFFGYLKALSDPPSGESAVDPFSKVIAIELEGCDRIAWVHQSVYALRQMIEAVQNNPQRFLREK